MNADENRARLVHILARVARGEPQALRELYDGTGAKLFGVCLRILKDRSEAEDVLQDVYVTVWRNAASFDAGRASPVTWLAVIARNRAIDRLRARNKQRTQALDDDFEVADAGPSGLDVLIDHSERAALDRCLAELDPKHARAINTAFLDGATYEEVARHLSVPLGTVKSWIRRGLARLRACLER